MSVNDISEKLADQDRAVFTIGVAADLVGVSVHTLRMYENEGLIIPDRTPSQRRMYSHLDIERIRCIRVMIEEHGLNLAGIRAMMSMIPCWELKPCTEADRATCDAYHKPLAPCWAVKVKGDHCQELDCRACHVYQSTNTCHNMKTFLKENWKGQ
jgi:MerR family transcriptional regulator/heat shock protein HspR